MKLRGSIIVPIDQAGERGEGEEEVGEETPGEINSILLDKTRPPAPPHVIGL